jgi:hypothetical protein
VSTESILIVLSFVRNPNESGRYVPRSFGVGLLFTSGVDGDDKDICLGGMMVRLVSSLRHSELVSFNFPASSLSELTSPGRLECDNLGMWKKNVITMK